MAARRRRRRNAGERLVDTAQSYAVDISMILRLHDKETLHLLRSAANAADLVQSIEDLKSGKGIAFNPTRHPPVLS